MVPPGVQEQMRYDQVILNRLASSEVEAQDPRILFPEERWLKRGTMTNKLTFKRASNGIEL